MFEAFVIRGQLDIYEQLVQEHNIPYIEISDGAIDLSHAEKCNYIRQFSQDRIVISEIGSKDKDKVQ